MSARQIVAALVLPTLLSSVVGAQRTPQPAAGSDAEAMVTVLLGGASGATACDTDGRDLQYAAVVPVTSLQASSVANPIIGVITGRSVTRTDADTQFEASCTDAARAFVGMQSDGLATTALIAAVQVGDTARVRALFAAAGYADAIKPTVTFHAVTVKGYGGPMNRITTARTRRASAAPGATIASTGRTSRDAIATGERITIAVTLDPDALAASGNPPRLTGHVSILR